MNNTTSNNTSTASPTSTIYNLPTTILEEGKILFSGNWNTFDYILLIILVIIGSIVFACLFNICCEIRHLCRKKKKNRMEVLQSITDFN